MAAIHLCTNCVYVYLVQIGKCEQKIYHIERIITVLIIISSQRCCFVYFEESNILNANVDIMDRLVLVSETCILMNYYNNYNLIYLIEW